MTIKLAECGVETNTNTPNISIQILRLRSYIQEVPDLSIFANKKQKDVTTLLKSNEI